MIQKKFSLEVIIGLCLALILQTNYRIFGESIGLGEIGLAASIAYIMILHVIHPPKSNIHRRYLLSWCLLSYLLAVLLPVTAINVLFETPGTSFRDFLAYLLSAILLINLTSDRINVSIIACSVVVCTLVLISLQFFFGGDTAYYHSTRFTGGAKNPNQLALYMCCCLLLTVIFIKKKFIKLPLIAAIIFFGFKSESDAFTVALALTFIALALANLVSREYSTISLTIVISAVLLCLAIVVLFFFELAAYLEQQWAAADEGGARKALYINGLGAWLSSPPTFFIGNGAGSFSGITESFQDSEAHNTPIDTLAMGGILGLFCFYYFPIKYIINAYSLNQRIVFSCAVGLICFSFFHFVARHPIFWFSIFALSEFIWVQKKQDHQ